MQLPNRPAKSRVERIAGQDVTLRLYDRRVPHDAVIEFEAEADGTWIVAVDDGDAELIETTTSTTEATVPGWCRDALRDAGVPATAL